MAAGGQAPGHTSCELDENSRLQEKHSGQEDNGFEYTGMDSEYETQNTELVNVSTGKMSNFEIVSCHSNTNRAFQAAHKKIMPTTGKTVTVLILKSDPYRRIYMLKLSLE